MEHAACMLRQLAVLVISRRRELKAAWKQRLCAAPPKSPLANPEILFHRMNDTLDQLNAFLCSHAVRRKLDGPPLPWIEMRDRCHCGLNPLLDYFETGAAAINAALPTLDEPGRTLLDQAWRLIAQREIELLCSVCCRVCTPELQAH